MKNKVFKVLFFLFLTISILSLGMGLVGIFVNQYSDINELGIHFDASSWAISSIFFASISIAIHSHNQEKKKHLDNF